MFTIKFIFYVLQYLIEYTSIATDDEWSHLIMSWLHLHLCPTKPNILMLS